MMAPHGALTKLGLFFPVVCFIHVFDQALAEQLYRDHKGLYQGFPHLTVRVLPSSHGCAVAQLQWIPLEHTFLVIERKFFSFFFFFFSGQSL